MLIEKNKKKIKDKTSGNFEENKGTQLVNF